MSFFKRRVVLFLLLDAALLAGLMGVFAAVNHAFVPSPPLSDRILITPTVAAAPETLKIHEPGEEAAVVEEPGAPEPVDLKRLLCDKLKVALHKVERGENYWTIAKKNHVDIYTLIGANPDMPYKATLRLTLNILPEKGVLHTILKGEDLSKIAAEYRTDVKKIERENGLSWWRHAHAGDVLFIPDVRPIRMVEEWREYFSKRGMFGCPFAKWATLTSPFAERVDPITGEERWHKGVDLRAKYGDPVYAAASGRVIFTGVLGGYGNLIQISHGKGYVTYYGHLSKIYAKRGQKVRRGALIGRVGATGRVTGPHLHFEIRKNGKALDPLQFI